jgi:hypothetical protein
VINSAGWWSWKLWFAFPNRTCIPRAKIWNAALAAGAQNFIRKSISNTDELIITLSLARERKNFIISLPKETTTLRRVGSWDRFSELYPEGIVIDHDGYPVRFRATPMFLTRDLERALDFDKVYPLTSSYRQKREKSENRKH